MACLVHSGKFVITLPKFWNVQTWFIILKFKWPKSLIIVKFNPNEGETCITVHGTASSSALHSFFHLVSPVTHMISNNDLPYTLQNYTGTTPKHATLYYWRCGHRERQRWKGTWRGIGTVIRQRSFGHFQGMELRILKVNCVLRTEKQKTLYLSSWFLNLSEGVQELGFSRSLLLLNLEVKQPVLRYNRWRERCPNTTIVCLWSFP